MSDWAVGDLAVCVDNEPRGSLSQAATLLRRGQVYTVLAVTSPYPWKSGYFGHGLVLDGAPHPLNMDCDWPAYRFRKIRPDEREACEPEFVTLLNRSKQRHDAERYRRAVEAIEREEREA